MFLLLFLRCSRQIPTYFSIRREHFRAAIDTPAACARAGHCVDRDVTVFRHARLHGALPVIALLVHEAQAAGNVLRNSDARILHHHDAVRRAQADAADQTAAMALDHMAIIAICAAAKIADKIGRGHVFRVAAYAVHAGR